MNNADNAPQLTLPDGHTVSLVGRMRLGRGSHTDIPLEDSAASREHAEIGALLQFRPHASRLLR